MVVGGLYLASVMISILKATKMRFYLNKIVLNTFKKNLCF